MGSTAAIAHRARRPEHAPDHGPKRTPQLGPAAQLTVLQRQAGNAAVAGLIPMPGATSTRASGIAPFVLQRKGAVPALPVKPPAKKKRAAPVTDVNYQALALVIEDQIDNYRKPGPVKVTPAEALHPRHGELLGQLHRALLLMRGKDPESALGIWQSIEPRFATELTNGAKAGLDADIVALTRQNLTYASEKLFYPAAYWAAKEVKKAEGHIEAPDLAIMAKKLKKAEAVVVDAQKLFEDAAKMGAGLVDEKLLKLDVGGIIDIVHMPGTIEEKLAAARKNGIATTAADLVSKVSGAAANIMKQTAYVGTKYCAIKGAMILKAGGKEAAKRAGDLKTLGKKFEVLGKTAEKVAKFAAVLAVINDYKNLIVAIVDGNYDAAVDAAVDLLTDAAPLAFGADLAGPLAVGVVAVKGVIESIRLAAAFIRWCEDETVRLAALDFVEVCTKLAKGAAYDLVANAEIIQDASRSAIRHLAAKQIVLEGQRVAAGLKVLGSHVTSTQATSIGKYPGVKNALGKEALDALFLPQEDPLNASNQVIAVFKGANAMARYVQATYTN